MPFVFIFVVSIVATYWTFKDAKSRGMNAQGWALFILLTSMLGLPIYLVVRRPKTTSA